MNTTRKFARTLHGASGAFRDATYASQITRYVPRHERIGGWLLAIVIGVALAACLFFGWSK